MSYFPFMIEIKDHKALVVGAGKSARDKIKALKEFGAVVKVVAPVISADVIKQGKDLLIERRVYRPGEAKGFDIVVAATDNDAINKQVMHDAKKSGVICTVADDPKSGGFIFPSVIKKENYSVAVSTDGKSPLLENKIKEDIEDILTDDMEMLASVARKKDPKKGGADEAKEDDDSDRERLADLSDNGNIREARYPEHVEEPDTVRLGAFKGRSSEVKSEHVRSLIEARGRKCEIVLLDGIGGLMPGDADAQYSIASNRLEEALLMGDIDIAMHDARHLPLKLAEGLCLAAALTRANPKDVLVTRKGTTKAGISNIAVSGPKEKVQIEKYLSSGTAEIVDGELAKLVRELKDGKYDAVIASGDEFDLMRLGDDDELCHEEIDTNRSLPAAGQGVITLETRKSGAAHDLAALFNDRKTMDEINLEREFLGRINAGNNDAVACHAVLLGDTMMMKVMKYIGGKCVYFAGSCKNGESGPLIGELEGKIRREEK